MARSKSTEKDGASLKYEVRVLEKELEIRNEEREFNRRTSEVSHKQHLESVKKIAKLESECQRLRVLVRKRLPGPAALAKMKYEVEMLGKDSVDNYSDSPSKRIYILTEQLCAIEEENKALIEALNNKTSELQLSRAMYAKLSEVESRFEGSSKSVPNNESTRNSLMLSSMSDFGIDDKASSAGSWASALVSEIEHFRSRQLRESSSRQTVVSSEINLMDDFVEMEKLALVSADQMSVSSRVTSGEAKGTLGPLQTASDGNALLNNEMKSESPLLNKVPSLLQDIPKAILEQSRATQRNPDEILEDVRKALASMSYPNATGSFDEKEDSGHPDLSKSICRIIELIEGISLPSPDYNIPDPLSEKDSFSYKHSETPSGYMVRVFQWKTSEISAVLQQFVQACYDLLNGKPDLNKFTQELTSVLDWIINHRFSLQDVSSMRDAMKNRFDWDESQSESEVGIAHQFATYNKDDKNFIQKEEPNVKEENRNQGDELINEEVVKQHPEDKLQSTVNRSEYLINQLEESEMAIVKLQAELHTLRKTENLVEGQVEKPKWFDNLLSSTKYDLNEACQKFPSQDLESKKNINCHEELETTCLDSAKGKEIPNSEVEQEGNQFRTNLEIAAASEKLAECQETILNLGKQLKALAAPKEAAAIFDNVISTPNENVTPMTSTTIPTPPKKKLISRRPSLLDQMIIEDKAKGKCNLSSSFISNRTIPIVPTDNVLVLKENKQQEDNAAVKSLVLFLGENKEGVYGKSFSVERILDVNNCMNQLDYTNMKHPS